MYLIGFVNITEITNVWNNNNTQIDLYFHSFECVLGKWKCDGRQINFPFRICTMLLLMTTPSRVPNSARISTP